MNKYVRYAMWLAKTIIVVAAVVAFVKYFMTFDSVYSAMFTANIAVLMALAVEGGLIELGKRVADIEQRQYGFAVCAKTLAAEQLDCKERVDNLIKTLNGDE